MSRFPGSTETRLHVELYRAQAESAQLQSRLEAGWRREQLLRRMVWGFVGLALVELVALCVGRL